MIRVTVIGSLKKSEDMMSIKGLLCNMFNTETENIIVNIPCSEEIQDMPLLDIQMLWYKYIKDSDFVVTIPKKIENYTSWAILKGDDEGHVYEVLFGESTSYEMAIAKSLNKPIFILDNLETKLMKEIKEDD